MDLLLTGKWAHVHPAMNQAKQPGYNKKFQSQTLLTVVLKN